MRLTGACWPCRPRPQGSPWSARCRRSRCRPMARSARSPRSPLRRPRPRPGRVPQGRLGTGTESRRLSAGRPRAPSGRTGPRWRRPGGASPQRCRVPAPGPDGSGSRCCRATAGGCRAPRPEWSGRMRRPAATGRRHRPGTPHRMCHRMSCWMARRRVPLTGTARGSAPRDRRGRRARRACR